MLKKIFLSERLTAIVIAINAVGIIVEGFIGKNDVIAIIDLLCISYFIVEMIVKHAAFGFKGYWQNGWNVFDGILVILSFASIFLDLLTPIDSRDLSTILVARVFRLIRFFRVFHFFPSFPKLVRAFAIAIRQCGSIALSFCIIMIVMSTIDCGLYREIAPDMFGTPVKAFYTIFRLFTVEGWYEIPDAIAANSSPLWGSLSTVFFCVQLILGGIIGMSFINSIFVDAMVSDNNDEVLEKIDDLNKQISELKDLIRKEKTE